MLNRNIFLYKLYRQYLKNPLEGQWKVSLNTCIRLPIESTDLALRYLTLIKSTSTRRSESLSITGAPVKLAGMASP